MFGVQPYFSRCARTIINLMLKQHSSTCQQNGVCVCMGEGGGGYVEICGTLGSVKQHQHSQKSITGVTDEGAVIHFQSLHLFTGKHDWL